MKYEMGVPALLQKPKAARLTTPRPRIETPSSKMLKGWLKARPGRQKQVSLCTGITESHLSHMTSGEYGISMQNACLIEIATGHELLAEELCPARAGLILAIKLGERFPVGSIAPL